MLRLNQLLATNVGADGGELLEADDTTTVNARAIGAIGGDMTVTFTTTAQWGAVTITDLVLGATDPPICIGIDAVTSVAGTGHVQLFH